MSYVLVAAGVFAGADVAVGVSKSRQLRADATAKQMAVNYQATQEEQASQQQADIIRRAGAYSQARATTAYAASGVQVDSGSAAVVNDQIETNTAHDAFTAILNGTKRADQLRAGGTIDIAAGRVAADSALLSAGMTAAQTLYSGYMNKPGGGMSGWSTYSPKSSGWAGGDSGGGGNLA